MKNACSRKAQIVVVLHARAQPEGWGALVTFFFFPFVVFRVFFYLSGFVLCLWDLPPVTSRWEVGESAL